MIEALPLQDLAMSPRELLGVFVKAAGLTSLGLAVFDLYHIVLKIADLDIFSRYSMAWDVHGVISWGSLGVVLIVCTDPIVRFVYWADLARLREIARHR